MKNEDLYHEHLIDEEMIDEGFFNDFEDWVILLEKEMLENSKPAENQAIQFVDWWEQKIKN